MVVIQKNDVKHLTNNEWNVQSMFRNSRTECSKIYLFVVLLLYVVMDGGPNKVHDPSLKGQFISAAVSQWTSSAELFTSIQLAITVKK